MTQEQNEFLIQIKRSIRTIEDKLTVLKFIPEFKDVAENIIKDVQRIPNTFDSALRIEKDDFYRAMVAGKDVEYLFVFNGIEEKYRFFSEKINTQK